MSPSPSLCLSLLVLSPAHLRRICGSSSGSGFGCFSLPHSPRLIDAQWKPGQSGNLGGLTFADRVTKAKETNMLIDVPARLETPGFMGDNMSIKVSKATEEWLASNRHT